MKVIVGVADTYECLKIVSTNPPVNHVVVVVVVAFPTHFPLLDLASAGGWRLEGRHFNTIWFLVFPIWNDIQIEQDNITRVECLIMSALFIVTYDS